MAEYPPEMPQSEPDSRYALFCPYTGFPVTRGSNIWREQNTRLYGPDRPLAHTSAQRWICSIYPSRYQVYSKPSYILHTICTIYTRYAHIAHMHNMSAISTAATHNWIHCVNVAIYYGKSTYYHSQLRSTTQLQDIHFCSPPLYMHNVCSPRELYVCIMHRYAELQVHSSTVQSSAHTYAQMYTDGADMHCLCTLLHKCEYSLQNTRFTRGFILDAILQCHSAHSHHVHRCKYLHIP